jgi:hypothetical protein
LRNIGIVSAAAVVGTASLAKAEKTNPGQIIEEYWRKRQEEYEALEEEARREYQAYDSPPQYIYRGTDSADRTPAFYAPLQQECNISLNFNRSSLPALPANTSNILLHSA